MFSDLLTHATKMKRVFVARSGSIWRMNIQSICFINFKRLQSNRTFFDLIQDKALKE
jgi:hypothetical protein